MKIVFIYPDLITPMINFCPSVHILSAVLKRAGHQTSLIHVNDNHGTLYNKAIIINRVRNKDPDLIGITSTTFNYRYANKIAGWLKKEFPDVPCILGGAHATVQPEDFTDSNFDAFCIGEGEEPLLDSVNFIENGRDWKKTPNLITRDSNGNILHNPVRGFLRDLDSLPYLDYDIIDTSKILKLRGGWMSISFSRGCPYECTFCINHIYKKRGLGPKDKLIHYPRRRSPKNAVNELESLAKKFKGQIKIFNFDDDNLSMDKKWMKDFVERYKRQILDSFGIKYAMNFRATFLDDELASLLSFSGCLEARIGFETGNEALRTKVLNKPISNTALIRAFSACDRYGIRTNSFAMMGIPGESEETFFDTVSMILRLKPYLIRMTFLYPYVHTKIFDLCIKKNLFKPIPVHEDSFTESPLRFEELTDEQIFCFRFLFPWYVNVLWFGNSEEGRQYKMLIDEFVNRPFTKLRQSIPEVIEKDRQIDTRYKRPHYRYFKDNIYYFQLKGKYDGKGNILITCVS